MNERIFDTAYTSMNNRPMNTDEKPLPAKLIADAIDAAMKDYDGGRGIKQAPLSRISGVSQPTISRALKGSVFPELDTLIRLTDALGNVDLGKTIGSILGAYRSARPYTQNTDPTVQHAEMPTIKLRSQRDRDIEDINKKIALTSDRGLVALLHEAEKIAERFPAQKETPSSSA